MAVTIQARHILCAMVFWGQIQNYMMRKNLSLLIVAMVKDPGPKITNSTEEASLNETLPMMTCMDNRNFEEVTQVKDGTHEGFDWDGKTKGQVLGAMYIGYVTTQLIGGRLTEYYGVKRIYGLGLFLCALLCFLSPVVAKWNVWAFFVLRILQGMFEGVTFPALQAMIVRWVPIQERNSFMSRSFMGSVFGLVITFPLCGIIIDSYGWEAAFYVCGGLTCVWFVFWCFLVFDTPEKHPRISAQEKQYILHNLGKTIDEKPKPIPWKSILTSVPVWGMIITDCGNCWGLVTLASYGPSYLKYILGVDIKTNGALSGLPMLSRYIGGIFCAAIADYILTKKYLSIVSTRRIFNSICMFGPAIVMFVIAFPPSGFECNIPFVMSLLCIGMFFNGALTSGHFAAPGDLAPNYAGTVFGMSNTISGGAVAYSAPVVIGIITNENMTFDAWTIVWSIASVVFIVTNVIYLFMIRGEIQSWNYQAVSS